MSTAEVVKRAGCVHQHLQDNEGVVQYQIVLDVLTQEFLDTLFPSVDVVSKADLHLIGLIVQRLHEHRHSKYGKAREAQATVIKALKAVFCELP